MSNYRRDQTLGGTWFFTVIAFNRRPIFCDEIFRKSLKQSIQRTRKKYPFKIDGLVLLPDHLHCVWTLPVGDANYSLRWKLIKQFVTKDCRDHFHMKSGLTDAKRKRRESDIWQRRFWEHKIRDDNDFANHLDYIHFNPVKHAHCDTPVSWRFSSFHRYHAMGVYPKNWAITNPPKFTEKEGFGE